VEWGREVLDAEQNGGGVSVRLAGGQSLRTGWLVGCDGAHSRVRKLAGIGFPGVAIIERFLLADVQADLPLPHDTASVWLRGEDVMAAFPLPGAGLWRLMATAAADGADEPAPEELLTLIVRLFSERTGSSVVQGAEWTSTFQIHRRLAETYRRGRMLLAGDAAHIHSPLGGQGMNTGLGDAENLAWKLALVATGRADQALLDSYEAERRPIATEVLESTSAMTRLVLGESPIARAVRDRLFVPLMNRPLVQRLIWEQASQLKVSYRHGPLARGAHLPLRGHRRPGDRVPDMSCRRREGGLTRLHAELGAKWVLLTAPTPGGEACASALRDRLGAEAFTLLEPADGWLRHALLIRPDAHLAWQGVPVPEALDRWLTAVLKGGRVMRQRRPNSAFTTARNDSSTATITRARR